MNYCVETKFFDCVRFYSLVPRSGNKKNGFLLIEKVFPYCLFNGELKARGYVMAKNKKLKNLRTFRDGYRSFVQKTIDSVAQLLSGENPVDVKKLKLICAGLPTKYSAFQALDREIAEQSEDVSKIEQIVVEGCVS